jgi:GxxExxY protein
MGFPAHSHPHSELTGQIIGAAQTVHRALRPGLDEKLYENALCVEFEELNLAFEQQMEFPVHYKERLIGKLRPDLIASETVLVETKVVSDFNDKHIAQVLGYLNITGLEIGLLLNFKHASLQVKRVAVPPKSKSQSEKSEKSEKSAVNLLDPPTQAQS